MFGEDERSKNIFGMVCRKKYFGLGDGEKYFFWMVDDKKYFFVLVCPVKKIYFGLGVDEKYFLGVAW